MKVATLHSRCECQASLVAELDESRHVLRGWVVDRRKREQRPAPAHAIHSGEAHFQIGWLCPLCVRNTLRAFDAGGLAWREQSG